MELENEIVEGKIDGFDEFEDRFVEFKEYYDEYAPDGPNKQSYWDSMQSKLYQLAMKWLSKK